MSVSFDLGVGAIINKLDEINERRKRENVNYLMSIYYDLESAGIIITELVNIFVELATGYASRAVLNDPRSFEELVDATNKYLNRRVLMDYLDRVLTPIRGAAKDKRVRDHKAELPEAMDTLIGDIDRFLLSIDYLQQSGFGHQYLKKLYAMSDELRLKKLSIEDVVQYAREALAAQKYGPTSNLQRSIGTIMGMLR